MPSAGPSPERIWRPKWLSGMAYEDFKIRPDVQPDGTVVFTEHAPWAIVWWLVFLVAGGIVSYAVVFEFPFWQTPTDISSVLLGASVLAVTAFSLYRMVRILFRVKRLEVAAAARTVRIKETWPHHFDETRRLDEAEFLVRPLSVSGYRLSWDGYCLIAHVGEAWFVIAADHLGLEAATDSLPAELRSLGITARVDADRAIRIRPAK